MFYIFRVVSHLWASGSPSAASRHPLCFQRPLRSPWATEQVWMPGVVAVDSTAGRLSSVQWACCHRIGWALPAELVWGVLDGPLLVSIYSASIAHRALCPVSKETSDPWDKVWRLSRPGAVTSDLRRLDFSSVSPGLEARSPRQAAGGLAPPGQCPLAGGRVVTVPSNGLRAPCLCCLLLLLWRRRSCRMRPCLQWPHLTLSTSLPAKSPHSHTGGEGGSGWIPWGYHPAPSL